MKYRKKPVEVEAIQFTGSNYDEIMAFCPDLKFTALQTPIIKTLEGDMMVSNKDWIVKGVEGEFYPVKPDIFKQTYEVI